MTPRMTPKSGTLAYKSLPGSLSNVMQYMSPPSCVQFQHRMLLAFLIYDAHPSHGDMAHVSHVHTHTNMFTYSFWRSHFTCYLLSRWFPNLLSWEHLHKHTQRCASTVIFKSCIYESVVFFVILSGVLGSRLLSTHNACHLPSLIFFFPHWKPPLPRLTFSFQQQSQCLTN